MMGLLAGVVGYLLGSLPFGVWIARMHGLDIFAVGSKSSGATNVRRVLGRKLGILVFCLDTLKGSLAVGCGLWCDSPYGALLCAMLGHSFSMFAHFRGGKGVATLMGGLAILVPLPLVMGCGVWLLVFAATRYVSLASMSFACALPCISFFYYPLHLREQHGIPLLLLACVILWFHRPNLQRLRLGKEHRF
jgi:glycerol-3-phosphate acyltransferase PlsY